MTIAVKHDGADVMLNRVSDGGTVKYTNGLGIDEKLSLRVNGGSPLYFVADHLGSTRALTDASGNVVERTDYDSFGNGAGSLLTRYGYTGRELDADTGLMYYRARWYDPQAGRFLSEDPIGFAGGVNWYAYVENNPLSYTDPDGLQIRRPGMPGIPGITPPGGSPGGVRDPDFPPGVGPNQSPAPWWSRIFTKENCPPGADECRKRKQQCFAECQYELDFPGRAGHDNMLRFRACVRRCMNAAGCDY